MMVLVSGATCLSLKLLVALPASQVFIAIPALTLILLFVACCVAACDPALSAPRPVCTQPGTSTQISRLVEPFCVILACDLGEPLDHNIKYQLALPAPPPLSSSPPGSPTQITLGGALVRHSGRSDVHARQSRHRPFRPTLAPQPSPTRLFHPHQRTDGALVAWVMLHPSRPQ